MTDTKAQKRIDLPGDWRRVSPRLATVEIVSDLIGMVFWLAAAVVPFLFIFREKGWPWWAYLPAAAVVVFTGLSICFALLRIKWIGYREREDDLIVRRGFMFRRLVAVPYGRMQVVDITQGPLERMFGLQTLKMVTAAATGELKMPGLAGQDANELRDRLVAKAESRRAGL